MSYSFVFKNTEIRSWQLHEIRKSLNETFHIGKILMSYLLKYFKLQRGLLTIIGLIEIRLFRNDQGPAAAAAAVTSVVSDSVWPHIRQPTRLPWPWDSPGKNTGVGYHFLLQCMKVKSEREVAQSCLTLCNPIDCSPPGSSIHGIFQARVLEWVAISFSMYLLRLHKYLTYTF